MSPLPIWRTYRSIWLLAVLAWCCGTLSTPAQPATPVQDPGLLGFIDTVEETILSGDPSAYLDLIADTADFSDAMDFADENIPERATAATLKELAREPLADLPEGVGYRLVLDTFIEQGRRARIATWRLDVQREEATWRIVSQWRPTALDGLYRVPLSRDTQYDVSNLTVRAEDLTLTLPAGSAFVAETGHGVTAVVLIGRGQMTFSPAPAAERQQVRLFSRDEVLQAEFDAVFIRVNPYDFESHFSPNGLTARPVDPRALDHAQRVFDEYVDKSFELDLANLDLTPDTWSLLPPEGDFLAEIETRRYDTLTYVRSWGVAEDVSLFDRRRNVHVALYASEETLARRGRFYDEADLIDYDILDTALNVSVDPTRDWVEGFAQLKIRIKASAAVALTMSLSRTLHVQSVVSNELGRLLSVRPRNRDRFIVNLPRVLPRGTEFTVTIRYAGRVRPARLDEVGIGNRQRALPTDILLAEVAPRHLYSTSSRWYPQSPVSDYGTATLRITLPSGFMSVASGEPVSGGARALPGNRGSADPGSGVQVFSAGQPVRYLALVISRFGVMRSETVRMDGRSAEPAGTASSDEGSDAGKALTLRLTANGRRERDLDDLSTLAADILRYYASLTGEFPYPDLTVALVESQIPGGHSPAYFTMLNQPLASTPFVWINDPASFVGFPESYLAHELAHQWWGQAVGWKNYHEQWLSEGFAQYFTVLYAGHARGESRLDDIVRKLRDSSLEHSDQGPVHLGYRLGRIDGGSRVFRALVYNKGAGVLHMLRRLVGDEAFFRTIRRYYQEYRYRKAGTDDFRQVVEAESGLSLGRFFERWIYGSDVPTLTFSYRVEPAATGTQEAVVRFEQTGDVFDVPVTVTLHYASGASADVTVPVTDRVTEARIPLAGELRRVEANRDRAALCHIRQG